VLFISMRLHNVSGCIRKHSAGYKLKAGSRSQGMLRVTESSRSKTLKSFASLSSRGQGMIGDHLQAEGPGQGKRKIVKLKDRDTDHGE